MNKAIEDVLELLPEKAKGTGEHEKPILLNLSRDELESIREALQSMQWQPIEEALAALDGLVAGAETNAKIRPNERERMLSEIKQRASLIRKALGGNRCT